VCARVCARVCACVCACVSALQSFVYVYLVDLLGTVNFDNYYTHYRVCPMSHSAGDPSRFCARLDSRRPRYRTQPAAEGIGTPVQQPCRV